MQRSFSFLPQTLGAIEAALSQARLARFLPEAGGDRQRAIRLYIWNIRLCEAFYLPTQLAEVCARNAIVKPVARRFTNDWHASPAFRAILPPRLMLELDRVVDEEQRTKRGLFTVDHVVAGLSFGFWLNLLTAGYDKQLWLNGVRVSFPYFPGPLGRQDLYDRLDRMRRWRNRIAHHNAIFDKNPRAELVNTLDIIGWVCPETRWLAAELTNVEQVLGRKPRP